MANFVDANPVDDVNWQDYENSWMFHSKDNYANGGALYQWLAPGEAQYSEYSQQMLATMYQNHWNSAAEQMKRAKEAGINPLTAAGAIAGNGTSSVASAPDGVAPSNPIGDVAGAVADLSGGFGSVAKGLADLSAKKETDTLLHDKLRNLRNDADLKFEQVGLTKSQAVIAASSAEYADENALRDIQMKRVRVKQMSREYENLKAVHDQILADIDLKIADAELHGSQKDYYDQLKLKTEEEVRFIKADNEFWEANHFNRHASSSDLIISQLIANGEDPDAFIQAWIDYHGQYQSAVSFAEAEAKNTSDELHNRVGTWADAIGRASRILGLHTDYVVNGIKGLIHDIGSHPKAREIRNELRMILDNAYEQLDKYPDDAERINKVISDMNAALNLSNTELVKWYESSK